MADNSHIHYHPDLGVSWVPVDSEPNHIELYRNDTVRIYEATIPPGAATAYHRHDRNTLYVVTAGGRIRSDETGHQSPGTKPGRSVTLSRKLSWLARRTLGNGTIDLPTGTLLMQPHATRPLIHRVVAHSANPAAVRMVGVELHQVSEPAKLPTGGGLRLEHANRQARTYRVGLSPGAPSRRLPLPRGAVLITTAGWAEISQPPQAPVHAGSARWLDPGELTLQPIGAVSLTALIIAF